MFDGPAAAGTNPVASGIQLAAQRLERYGTQFSPDAVQEAVERAIEVLREDVGDRTAGFGAVEMFIESVTVGAFVRNMNHEASLTSDDLQQAFTTFRLLLNSLWHFTCEF